MIDYSFLKFYKNDFQKAVKSDNPNIATMPYTGFVQQKTNETFCQKTSQSEDIVFSGDILVELVDLCENVKKDITSNFYYYGYEDLNGIKQIDYEFGNINEDFYLEPLSIRITDLINDNKWYSNLLCVTDYRSEFSTRFDYTNQSTIDGIDYTTSQRIQSIRIGECYEHTPVNERNSKQYTTSQGKRVNYRQILTFLDKYLINGIDKFTNNRLEVLFSHSTIYIDNQLVVVSDLKVDERIGDTNFFNGSFSVNPQNEFLTPSYQLYEGLEVIELIPFDGTLTTQSLIVDYFIISFNKQIILNNFQIKLYKDNILQTENIQINVSQVLNNVIFEFLEYTFENGEYNITIDDNSVNDWDGLSFGEWTFTITDGEFEITEFNYNEFLTN